HPLELVRVHAHGVRREGTAAVVVRLGLRDRLEVLRLRAHGSKSTPGLSTPLGSTAALAARSAAPNGSGRWASYHGRWSRPTAWWWVIVPPAARMASEAADFISSHCSSSSPRRAGARTVKYGAGPSRYTC